MANFSTVIGETICKYQNRIYEGICNFDIFLSNPNISLERKQKVMRQLYEELIRDARPKNLITSDCLKQYLAVLELHLRDCDEFTSLQQHNVYHLIYSHNITVLELFLVDLKTLNSVHDRLFFRMSKCYRPQYEL